MRVAIIDLGTNTFNLLIADIHSPAAWTPVFKIKEGVKLGQGGINNGTIQPEAFARGIAAMQRHAERISGFAVSQVFAFGTSALRDAANGADFLNEVKEKFGIEIELISGDKEAEFIYKGVKQTVSNISENFIILDIGGGSNEFIIGNNQILWKESYRLGMARLMELFHPPDPITPEVITRMEVYFEQELQSLFDAVEKYRPGILVGASGSFDSLVNIYYSRKYATDDVLPVSMELSLEIFNELHSAIIRSTSAERQQMQGLEPVRRDMIVLAVVFVNFVLKRLNIKKLYQSSYSLKEGALWEVMQNM